MSDSPLYSPQHSRAYACGSPTKAGQLHSVIISNNYDVFLTIIKSYNFDRMDHFINIIKLLIEHRSNWIVIFVKKYIEKTFKTKNAFPIEILELCNGDICIDIINEIDHKIINDDIYVQFAKIHPDYALKLEVLFEKITYIFVGLLYSHRFDIATKIIKKLNSKEVEYILNHSYTLHCVVYNHDVVCLNYLQSFGNVDYEKYIHNSTKHIKHYVNIFSYQVDIKQKGLILFRELCEVYGTIVTEKLYMFPLVLCDLINDYADNLMFLISRFEINEYIMMTPYYEIILKCGCRNYYDIADKVYDKYPEIIIPFLDKLQTPEQIVCDSKYFVTKNFGIIPPCYSSKKRKINNLSLSEISLLKILKQFFAKELVPNINAFDTVTLQNIVKTNFRYSIDNKCLDNRYYLILFIKYMISSHMQTYNNSLVTHTVLLLCCGILMENNINYLSPDDETKFLISFGNNKKFLVDIYHSLCDKGHIEFDQDHCIL